MILAPGSKKITEFLTPEGEMHGQKTAVAAESAQDDLPLK